MSDAPLPELGLRLFEAARSEQPSALLRQRILRAHRERRARVAVWQRLYLSVAAAVLTAGMLLLLRDGPAPVDIAAEAPPTPVSSATPPKPEPAPAPEARSTLALPRPVTVARPAPPTLDEELTSLKRARAALSADDPAQANRELDRFDRVLRGKQLRAEATLLRIEALSHSGRSQEAAALARRFLEENPNNPSVDWVRGLVDAPPPAASSDPPGEGAP